MNRYMRSQVILNVNNKKFHQILQLTTENAIFASKSETEKKLIFGHRNSPDIYYAIKHNNVFMLEKYFYRNKTTDRHYYRTKMNIEWTEIINFLYNYIRKYYHINWENISLLKNPTGMCIYFGNLNMLKKIIYLDMIIKPHIMSINFPSVNAFDFAIYMNHIHIVKYLTNLDSDLLHKRPISVSLLNNVVKKNNNLKMFKILYDAYKRQQLENCFFRYSNDRDEHLSFFDDKKNGHKKMFKYFQEKNV